MKKDLYVEVQKPVVAKRCQWLQAVDSLLSTKVNGNENYSTS